MLGRRSKPAEFRALNDVTFDIYQGETFGIIGHNGSGKSTLLKLISGIMEPTDGDILVRGRLAALLELGAGFHPELTGSENIFLNGSILGLDREYVEEAYDDIVGFAELEGFIDVPVKHYSSGMRARLGFSVATHLEPDVLLIDEVLAVGDERFKRKCMERVHRFRSLGRTMVLVSHSASTVAQLCSRSAVLDDGELLFVGDSEEAIKIHRAALSRRSTGHTSDRPEADSNSTPVKALNGRFIGDDVEPSLRPESDLTFLAEVRVFRPVEMRVRLTIRTEEGLVLFNRASSGLMGGPIAASAGDYTLAFTLRRLPLRDGRYIIDFNVESADGHERFDRLGAAAGFQVESGTRGLGLVVIDASCQLVQTPTNEAPEPLLGETV